MAWDISSVGEQQAAVNFGRFGMRKHSLAPAMTSSRSHKVLREIVAHLQQNRTLLREGFAAHLRRQDSPQEIADWILSEYRRDTDDALVLVARYLHGKANASTR